MKGIISSLIVLIAFLSGLFVVIVFANSVQEGYDIVSSNAVGDRVFYKFAAIENSVVRIMENDLNRSTFGVRLHEGQFDTVVLNFSLPSNYTNFTRDMSNLERFVESYLNETRLSVDLNASIIGSCMPMTIVPYNISVFTFNNTVSSCGFASGQRNLTIAPGVGAGPSINSIDFSVRANSTRINPASATWSPAGDCTGGSLNWTVRVQGNTSAGVYGPTTNFIHPDRQCTFAIYENVTGRLLLRMSNRPLGTEPNATLVAALQPGFSNVTFVAALNLTNVPGKLGVSLSPQSIKIRETLFQVERNDTVVVR